jgi:hypothetical protein
MLQVAFSLHPFHIILMPQERASIIEHLLSILQKLKALPIRKSLMLISRKAI